MIRYVESSAFMKLIVDEPETAALREELGDPSVRSSSELTIVETSRAAARLDGDAGLARARAALLTTAFVPISRPVIERAARLDPVELRSLDAIHVATALEMADPQLVFYSYDERTLAAARTTGLDTKSPGR